MANNSGTISGPIDWSYAKMLRTYSRYLGLCGPVSLEYFEERYWDKGRGRV